MTDVKDIDANYFNFLIARYHLEALWQAGELLVLQDFSSANHQLQSRITVRQSHTLWSSDSEL
jgi:hypothetical protein